MMTPGDLYRFDCSDGIVYTIDKITNSNTDYCLKAFVHNVKPCYNIHGNLMYIDTVYIRFHHGGDSEFEFEPAEHYRFLLDARIVYMLSLTFHEILSEAEKNDIVKLKEVV